MKNAEKRLERPDSPPVDLSWLNSIDPEIEAHLLPAERAVLQALREYAKEISREG